MRYLPQNKHLPPMVRLFSVLFLLLLGRPDGSAQNEAFLNYINRYKDLAIREMERAGIPASIKLAQALLESNAGQSYLARKANNHFGIKCGNDWKGRKVWRKDDDFDEQGRLRESCFRAYKRAEDSYIAHSEFLRDPRKEHRYGFLFRLDPYDYKRWARGLKRAGYATGANYDRKLIQIIETYELYRFDRLSSDDLVVDREDRRLEPIAGLDIRLVNDARVVFAKAGDTPQNIALATGEKLKCILKYNDHQWEPADTLAENTRVFLQPKRNAYRGKKKWHYVKAGETMLSISQLYGVKLKKLYKRNLMPEGSEPAIGERIKLRGFKVPASERPKLHTREEPPTPFPVEDEEETLDVETQP
ncbi:MAG: LysM peptidoglycan-binding domain-containing protein, partial [Bacteroidetes bacterium]